MSRREVGGLIIDQKDTKIADDAIYLEKRKDGWYVEITFVDTTDVIIQGSFDDERAYQIGFQQCGVMIDKSIVHNDLSLLSPGDCDTITLSLTYNLDLDLIDHSVEQTRLIKKEIISYDDMNERLHNERHVDYHRFSSYKRFAKELVAKRQLHGCLYSYDSGAGMLSGESGQLKQLKESADIYAEFVVREFMILCNGFLAEYASKHQIPIIYRNQGSSRSSKQIREEYSHYTKISKDEGNPISDIKSESDILYTLFRSVHYSEKPDRHIALGLDTYAHFTAPLQRYADIVNQRLLVSYITNIEFPYSTEDLHTISVEINRIADKKREKEEFLMKRDGCLVDIDMGELSDEEFSIYIDAVLQGDIVLSKYKRKRLKQIFQTGEVHDIDLARLFIVADTEEWSDFISSSLEYLFLYKSRAISICRLIESMHQTDCHAETGDDAYEFLCNKFGYSLSEDESGMMYKSLITHLDISITKADTKFVYHCMEHLDYVSVLMKSFENLDYVSMDFDFDTTEEGLKRTLTVKVYDISYVMDHVYPVVSVISEIQKQELAKEFIEEYFPLLLDLCHTTIHAWEKRRENKASKYRVEDNRARALAGIITKREEREKELNKSIEQKEQELVDIDSTIKPSELAYNKNVLVISERVFPNIPDRFKNLIEVNPRIALDQLLQVNNLSALEYVVRRGSVLGSDMYQGSYALHWNQLTFSWMGDPCPSSDMAQFSAAKQVCLQTVFER